MTLLPSPPSSTLGQARGFEKAFLRLPWYRLNDIIWVRISAQTSPLLPTLLPSPLSAPTPLILSIKPPLLRSLPLLFSLLITPFISCPFS